MINLHMDLRSFKNKIKIPLILGVLGYSFFGLSQMGMNMNTMGGKANCPFGGHSMVICQMSPMEHIQEWQSVLTALPEKDVLSVLSALLSLLALLSSRFADKFQLFRAPGLEPYVNIFYSNGAPIFDPLREAFSRGILHPKLF